MHGYPFPLEICIVTQIQGTTWEKVCRLGPHAYPPTQSGGSCRKFNIRVGSQEKSFSEATAGDLTAISDRLFPLRSLR